MGKQHETIPNEPEVEQPNDPKVPEVPQEAPQNEPPEVPRQPSEPEIRPDKTGSDFNKTEV